LLNQHADAAAYFYESRLVPHGPIIGLTTGGGLQVHPLEPISGRLSATYLF
jgi:hypothetical protein